MITVLITVFIDVLKLKKNMYMILTYLICTGGGFPDPRLKLCCFPEKRNMQKKKEYLFTCIQ